MIIDTWYIIAHTRRGEIDEFALRQAHMAQTHAQVFHILLASLKAQITK